MEELLNSTVSRADLEKFEKNYHRELESNGVTTRTQFEYASCLIRSEYTSDIQKGVLLLEDLATRDTEGKRDYIYYLAIGNVRIKQYSIALKYCKAFLQIEPNNQQVLSLQEYIKNKMEKETMRGLAIAGSATLILGGLVGLGMALTKK